MTFFHYLIVLNDGAPLIMLRTPVVRRERRRGGPRYAQALRWKQIVQAVVALLKQHGLSRKNLLAFDSASAPEDWSSDVLDLWRTESARLEALDHLHTLESAYAGGPELPDWHLYEQDDTGAVTLKRAARGHT